MARRPPSRLRRGRIASVPRWAWVALVIGLVITAFLIVHLRARHDRPIVLSNRARLLREAQTTLRRDPNVADLVYAAPTDQWDVTPATPDVDSRAFGRYICFVLGQAAVVGAHTSVRVIDAARLEASGFDYAEASRGAIRCKEEAL